MQQYTMNDKQKTLPSDKDESEFRGTTLVRPAAKMGALITPAITGALL